ncbi:DNA repair protein XRCC1-like [Daphnia pulex]|uniref:DNA repair protein XRCC1-like n=1 Tax=Daphnia pulex TaxID=6669 RepID=UPI001EDECF44|nr:DNA repair protein XRCC1-like [Daphnia pulex]
MAPIKFTRVVSFSSEDPNQPTENLIKDGVYRKWRCKSAGEQKAWVEFQLEKTSFISAVDIGNHGSAFIEILVGRSGCSDEDYKVLLNSASFMTPQECRNETNLQRVRIFKHQDLNKATQAEKWDRVRVVCTQPFNKQLQYGISFLTVHAPEEESANKTNNNASVKAANSIDLGMFKLRSEESIVDPIKQGSLFSRFKSSISTSPSTQPGAIRAASQSLASAALAQSEKEALTILRHSPNKDGSRPDIKLTDKLKTLQTRSPTVSKTPTAAKVDQHSPLPSRKQVESDRPRPVAPPITPPAKKSLSKKMQESKPRHSPLHESKRVEGPVKRKTPPPSPSVDTQRLAKKQRTTKPFNRLLEGVVVVLSGFQNPLRGQLRDKLLALGATYKPEWNASCTHLICAFYNTPKFIEVKGKGKIVTKNWVQDCFDKRKRLPWRRYCLDKNDRGEESEEEIWEGEDQGPTCPTPTPQTSKAATVVPQSPTVAASCKPTTVVASPKTSVVKDEEEEDYGGSTEVDEVDTEDEIDMIKKKIKEQQQTLEDSNIYANLNFYLGKDLSEEVKEDLTLYIKECQGKLVPKIKSKVSHFISDDPDDDSVAKALSKNQDMKIVKSDWIRTCRKNNKLVALDEFLVQQTK